MTRKTSTPESPPSEEDATAFITVEDAVWITGLSERTIRKYVAEGVVPSFRIGTGKRKLVRMRKRDVLGLMKPMPGTGAAS
jgi:hypothetical protein